MNDRLMPSVLVGEELHHLAAETETVVVCSTKGRVHERRLRRSEWPKLVLRTGIVLSGGWRNYMRELLLPHACVLASGLMTLAAAATRVRMARSAIR